MHSTDLCSTYSPVPNNSLPAYQFLCFFVGPHFLIWTPPPLPVINFPHFLLKIFQRFLKLIILFANLQAVLISYQGCSYGGELARLGLLARLGEMIFIPKFIWNLLSQVNQKVC